MWPLATSTGSLPPFGLSTRSRVSWHPYWLRVSDSSAGGLCDLPAGTTGLVLIAFRVCVSLVLLSTCLLICYLRFCVARQGRKAYAVNLLVCGTLAQSVCCSLQLPHRLSRTTSALLGLAPGPSCRVHVQDVSRSLVSDLFHVLIHC
jgi:hypothetical protein